MMKVGADAVSIHTNVGAEDEAEMLRDLGRTARTCDLWGVPLIAMMYPRGPKVQSEHGVEYIRLAARIGSELEAYCQDKLYGISRDFQGGYTRVQGSSSYSGRAEDVDRK